MRKKITKSQILVFCLICEIAIFVLGMIYFNPFPIDNIKDSFFHVLMTILIYFAISGIVIWIGSIMGLFNKSNLLKVVVMAGFLVFLAPIWPIILGVLIVVTLTCMTVWKIKSSVLWGLFLVKWKNKNIRN